MSVTEIKSKIAAAADQLDEARALQLLEFAQTLLLPPGTSGQEILDHLDAISPATTSQMLDTLAETRQVDPHAW